MASDDEALTDNLDTQLGAETATEPDSSPTEQSPDSSLPSPDLLIDVPTGPETSSPKKSKRLERILSIKVPIIVKIAQKKMRMSEVLKFNLGNVIHFDQDAYQHVDLMVNNTIIGLGQPVKISENFGLKIVQIGDITDTIKALKSED